MKWAQKKCGKYLGIICVMCVEKVDKSVDNLEKQVDKMGKKNYTYIVKCRDGSLYTGWTNDLEKRMKAHNAGKGAKYTKSRRPVTLVYYESFETKEEAMRREYEIKHMPREKKEKIIERGRLQG